MEIFLIIVLIFMVSLLLMRKSGSEDFSSEFAIINRRLEKIYKEINDLKKLDNYSPENTNSSNDVTYQETIVKDEEKIKVSNAAAPLSREVVNAKIEEHNVEEVAIKNDVEVETPHKEEVTEYMESPSVVQERHAYFVTEDKEEEESWWKQISSDNPDFERFVGENLIAKIAIVILVLGISYFVKYAIDKNWINEIGRVAIGLLSGLILVGVSHYLQKQYKSFSSILVAGAITIFYFTIGYGFHVYHLYSQTTAFSIMVIITVFSVLISLYYDRQELALLSTIGGFAVPFMVSTGDGNYVVLFTYLIILNCGLFVLSYFKNWSRVQIVAFLFTHLIYGIWFSTKYPAISTSAHQNALLFINLFYILFLVINLIDIFKNRLLRLEFKLGFMLINTFLTFVISMNILHEFYPNLKGLYTLILAVINLSIAYLVFRSNKNDQSIIYILLGMTLVLATIAIPIQFQGHYITLFWALEAILLLWLSIKIQKDSLFTVALLVYLLTIGSLILDWNQYTNGNNYAIAANSIFITGLVVAAMFYLTWWLLRKESLNLKYLETDKFDSQIFLIAALIITYIVGFLEVNHQSTSYLSISRHTPLLIYHFVFTTIIVIALARYHTQRILITIFLGILNIFLFVVHIAYLPFREMSNGLINGTSPSHLDFYANFLYVLCIGLTVVVFKKIYRTHPEVFVVNRDKLITLFLIFILFLTSNQLLLYIMKYQVTQSQLDFNSYINLRTQLYKVLFPIVWGVLSMFYLGYGIKYKLRIVRVVALILILITVLKLFIYDMRDVSEGGKILALILLGIVMLIMAFMYQKIKVLIIEDNTTSDEN